MFTPNVTLLLQYVLHNLLQDSKTFPLARVYQQQQENGSTGYGSQSFSWPAEQGKRIFPCLRLRLKNWSREMGSAVLSRVSLLISILRLNLVLTYESPPEFRGGVHMFI